MAEPRDHGFYVGYLPRAPRDVAARVRRALVLLFLVATGVSLVLLLGQSPFDPGHYEFGVLREFRGVILERPYPLLLVPRPGVGGSPGYSSYALVGAWKAGAQRDVAGLDGQAVRLQGTLIYRDGETMVEVMPGGVARVSDSGEGSPPEGRLPSRIDLGQVTLRGEIVDSKCFLGVMKPGHLKPHRACAVRCISGGIPPLFLVRDDAGHTARFLLVGATGEPIHHRVLDHVAEPLEVRGRIVRLGDLLLLEADPAGFRRL